jgi:pimeloyl-ACP methyl ester carboxylesterase
MGGYITFSYTVRYPMDLKALLLIDTRAEADTAEGKAGRAKMIDAVRKEGSKSTADTMMPKMITPEAHHTRPQLAHRVRQMMEACPPLTIEHALEAMRDRRDFCDELPSIAVPTLILVGDGDVITTPAMAQTMHAGIRASKLVTIKGAGHLTPVEQPEQVSSALRQFLSGLS